MQKVPGASAVKPERSSPFVAWGKFRASVGQVAVDQTTIGRGGSAA